MGGVTQVLGYRAVQVSIERRTNLSVPSRRW